MHLLLANNSASGGGAARAFEALASATGTGNNTTITFSNISNYYANYDILEIRARWNYTGAGPATVQAFMGFNSDSTVANFPAHFITGRGSSLSGTNELNPPVAGFTIPTAVFSNEGPQGVAIISIMGYNNSNKTTTVKYINGANLLTASSDSAITIGSGVWNNTNNVTSITFQMSAGRVWSSNTEICLYGLKKAA